MTSRLALACLTAVAAALPPQSASGGDPHADLLARYKVQPDVDGIRSYLSGLVDPKRAAQAAALIVQLGDNDYSTREAASRELLLLASPPTGTLREAANSPDLEVRYRARAIIEKIEEKADRHDQVLHAALKTIQGQELKGLAAEILKTFPLCDQEFLRLAARDALRATTRPEDADQLRQAAKDPNAGIRAVALLALSKALGDAAAEELRPFLQSEEPQTRLAAAHALADLGDRACLEVLAAFLDADKIELRWPALRILWALTGKRFNYVPYDTPENRAKPAAAWRKWVSTEGKTAKLDFPLKPLLHESGRTLICLQNENRVIELDPTGTQKWEMRGIHRPWACQGLPNGHRLIASFNHRRLYEYDANGKLVWQKTGLPGGPSSVQRLPNGNTLVACSDSHLVVEVKQDGNIGWQQKITGRPFHAQRLDNGNTLVTLHQGRRVVEIDPEGKEVWQLPGFQDPQCAYRLQSGNTLVADHAQRKVLEYNREKKLIWSHQFPSQVYDAQRLANGNTLVGDRTGVYEVNPAGTVIWQKKVGYVSRICRY